MYNYEKNLSLEEIGLYSVMLDMPVVCTMSALFLAGRCNTGIGRIHKLLDSLVEKGFVDCINDRYCINGEKLIEDVLSESDNDEDCFFDEDDKIEEMTFHEFLRCVAEKIEK